MEKSPVSKVVVKGGFTEKLSANAVRKAFAHFLAKWGPLVPNKYNPDYSKGYNFTLVRRPFSEGVATEYYLDDSSLSIILFDCPAPDWRDKAHILVMAFANTQWVRFEMQELIAALSIHKAA